jgi:hypothetical protein
MRIFLAFFVLLLLASGATTLAQSKVQRVPPGAYTYAPDSSALSVLYQSIGLDSAHTRLVFDLKQLWLYRKSNRVRVHLRGSLVNRRDLRRQAAVPVRFNVFGKPVQQTLKAGEELRLEFTTTAAQIRKSPRIEVAWSPATGKVWQLYLDSIDMAAY